MRIYIGVSLILTMPVEKPIRHLWKIRTFVAMKEDGLRLKGCEVPDWFLEEERRLLELSATISELQSEQRRIRSRILSRMREEGIRSVDSGLCVCSRVSACVRRTVDVLHLKRVFPAVWRECLKEKKVSSRLTIRAK